MCVVELYIEYVPSNTGASLRGEDCFFDRLFVSGAGACCFSFPLAAFKDRIFRHRDLEKETIEKKKRKERKVSRKKERT